MVSHHILWQGFRDEEIRMKVPHLVQYQGSKRIIAPEIIKFFPDKINRLIEPFSGACAISILAAAEHKCNQLAKRTSQLRKVSGRTKTAEKLNRRMIGRYGMKCYLYDAVIIGLS